MGQFFGKKGVIEFFTSNKKSTCRTTLKYFKYLLSKKFDIQEPAGLITTPVFIYIKKESYSVFKKTTSNEMPEANQQNLVNTKLIQLSPSRLLIQTETGGLFPALSHIAITEKNIGVNRCFTE